MTWFEFSIRIVPDTFLEVTRFPSIGIGFLYGIGDPLGNVIGSDIVEILDLDKTKFVCLALQ